MAAPQLNRVVCDPELTLAYAERPVRSGSFRGAYSPGTAPERAFGGHDGGHGGAGGHRTAAGTRPCDGGALVARGGGRTGAEGAGTVRQPDRRGGAAPLPPRVRGHRPPPRPGRRP